MKVTWKALQREELEISGCRVIEDTGTGDHVALASFDEDAEFIELACNAHAGLVEALKSIHKMLQQDPLDEALIAEVVNQALALVTK